MTTVPTPEYPEPPETQICQMLQEIASLLSDAELDEADLRAMTLTRMYESLAAKGHSQASIEWAIYYGLVREFLVSSKLFVRERRQTSSSVMETRIRNVEQGALAATNKIWLAWKTGAFADRAKKKEEIDSIVVAFSGGGFRAAFFQLGFITYLQAANRLSNITGIVSVSGGSILAGHLVKNWARLTDDSKSFVAVAAEFVSWTKLNLRNRIVIKYLWSWWAVWSYFQGKGLTWRLRIAYDEFYEGATLGDLDSPNAPRIAIVATESTRRERVVFTPKRILCLPVTLFNDEAAHPKAIIATGIPLSLAVTASSCFPQVFWWVFVDHDDFGLTYEECKEHFYLDDGGVAGNLGIEVLRALRSIDEFKAESTIVCDAERPQVTKPIASPLASSGTRGAALSQSARDALRDSLGEKSTIIRFSNRNTGPLALQFTTETELFGFRTDLDAPTWPEVSALLLHGAATASSSLGELPNDGNERIRSTIFEIIKAAGGPITFTAPTSDELRGCNGWNLGRVLVHAIIVFASIVVAMSCLSWLGVSYLRATLVSRHVENGIDPDLDLTPTEIPPPTNFPPIEMSTFVPLNERDRKQPGFDETNILIENQLSEPIQVSFAYVPNPKADGPIGQTRYVDRQTLVILPGQTFKHYEESFGGPVHISVFIHGEWKKTNEWIDLRVVPSRKVIISEEIGQFRIRLEFEETVK